MTVVSKESAGERVVGELSKDALTEWRSSEQVENSTSSTSPPCWNIDDSDDDEGSKPSVQYGKYTWEVEKFSQNTQRELRSNEFEVGDYKCRHVLLYPQGCDVCDNVSLFLCVADHDKLIPGWGHLAQFTIAFVNKDPKKSRISDTLHRFWRKEHDWGWKKFMELSKLEDGFLNADTLIVKVQVQVIREKVDRLFRCLDTQYRRELARVYFTNVEQVCCRVIEEKRLKLVKLVEDEARWSSFHEFWLGMDQSTRRRISTEKKDTILKKVVKSFFIEKEVTSTLVMDTLYCGFKALEGQSKSKKGKAQLLGGEETPPPGIQIDEGMFVLAGDVLLLLKKAAVEPLPSRDDEGQLQDRHEVYANGEDLKRMTELGRKALEAFVLDHILSNTIEVAYQEAAALKLQEELIREEDAAVRATRKQSKVKKIPRKGKIPK